MKTTVHFCAWAVILFSGGGSPAAALVAQTGQEQPQPRSQVLVLDNERILQGSIHRQGDHYVIQQAAGELRVPATKVLVVCESLEDAFKTVSSRANLRDPGERLRLARWCQTHGLREQAVAEAKAALALQPGHAETMQLLALLEAAPPTTVGPTPPEPAPLPQDTPALDLTADCLALFATKVQPILMNTCASCHATGQGGNGFALTRAGDGAGRRTLQLNVRAVIGQINFDRPDASPLLFKACCAHGGAATAALANRQAPPFVTLQNFIQLVTTQNPQLRTHGTTTALAAQEFPGRNPGQPSAAMPAPQPPEALAARPVTNPGLVQAATAPAAATPAARQVEIVTSPTLLPGTNFLGTPPPRPVDFRPSTTPDAATEQASGGPISPYDPRPFNEMAHPKTK
jgi:hypothetical protein